MAAKEYYHDILNYLAKENCLEELIDKEINEVDRTNSTDTLKKQNN